MKIRFRHLSMLLIIVLSACAGKEKKKNINDFVKREFNLLEVSEKRLLYNDKYERKASFSKLIDNDSVPLFKFEDSSYYHPVLLAQKGLYVLNSYRLTKNKDYLEISEKIINKLIEISFTYDSAYMFPYPFNFPLHGREDDVMIAPWYSGMAQGQVLALMVRMYLQTKDSIYINYANKTFNSFYLFNGESDPWISYLDDNDYLWLEEYPKEPANYTLNGYIFAILGIYEYYLLTENPKAKSILNGSLTTMYDQIHEFRNDSGYSFYCKKHKVENEGYHKHHIKLLKHLNQITGEDYFLKIRNQFLQDLDVMDSLKSSK